LTAVALSPDISRAIDELEEAFPDRVTIVANDGGGAIVRISETELSARWSQPHGDLWFLIPYHYPDAAIYPYYLTGAVPGGGIIGGLQPVEWRGMPATQVSLRHNGWNPNLDTALGSVLQTQAWLRVQ
jgi:hypothetical protein